MAQKTEYNGTEVAAAILVIKGESMHYKDIADHVKEINLSGLGKTGSKTIDQTIGAYLRKRDDFGCFEKTGRGHWKATELAKNDPTIQ